MGKGDGGLLLILFALTALWLYNTGRAGGVLAIIKDPNYTPGAVNSGGLSASCSIDGSGKLSNCSLLSSAFVPTSGIAGTSGIGGIAPGSAGGLGGGTTAQKANHTAYCAQQALAGKYDPLCLPDIIDTIGNIFKTPTAGGAGATAADLASVSNADIWGETGSAGSGIFDAGGLLGSI